MVIKKSYLEQKVNQIFAIFNPLLPSDAIRKQKKIF